MTTKRKSSRKKSPAKKTVTKAKSTAGKTTVKRRATVRRKKRDDSKPKKTHFSEPAFDLIDRAAGFLKRAVSEADQATAYERKAIRENALSFVDTASKRLMQALDEESEPSRRRR
jgi:hypothetical protein